MRDLNGAVRRTVHPSEPSPGRARRALLHPRQMGITLIELVISIVVIGIAATAILQSLGFLTIGNVDPMLRSQSNLLAQNMLNEVLSHSFFEPDNDPRADSSATPAVCPTRETGSGYDRSLWDNVCDYRDFDSNNDDGNSGIRTKDGTPITELSGYHVQIEVDSSDSVQLGSLSNDLANCDAPRILRINVNVTDPRGQSLTLSGYRTSYWDEGC